MVDEFENVKKCSKHHIYFKNESDMIPKTEEFFYKNSSGNLYPYCKECSKKKAKDWSNKNKERRYTIQKKSNERRKDIIDEYRKNYRESGGQLEWQRNNKEKIKEYNYKRQSNKTHTFSSEEWVECLDYFDNSCAYCGMTMEEHRITYGKSLHREHVDHEGSNGIENCVPSCVRCNSSKGTMVLLDWYKDQAFYSIDRVSMIDSWIESC